MAGIKAPGAMTREMVMVHTGLRREFGFMSELTRGVFQGDRHRAQLIAEHIELMWSILDRHHRSEDLVLWPRLLERCPDEILPLVHDMEKQHEKVASLGSDLTRHATAWRTDASVMHRDTLLRTLDDLIPALFEHLGLEETYVLPLVEKHITSDEWDSMVATGGAETPPDQAPLIFGILMYEGAPAAVRDALDNMPERLRGLISEAAPRLYGDHAEKVYGTRNPPYGFTLFSRV